MKHVRNLSTWWVEPDCDTDSLTRGMIRTRPTGPVDRQVAITDPDYEYPMTVDEWVHIIQALVLHLHFA